MRAALILVLLALPACKKASPEREKRCAVFAQREMSCMGIMDAKRGDAMYDVVYETCVDPEDEPEVTKTLVRGASMGDHLVSFDEMIACAQKPIDCDAYTACYGGQRVKR